MKKILLILSRLDRGGAELRTLKLLQKIDNNIDIKFYIYLNSGETGILDDEYKKCKNVNIVYGDKGVKGLIKFVDLIKNKNFDILHINCNIASGLYAFLGKLFKIPLVFSHLRTSENYGTGVIYDIKKIIFSFLMNKYSNKVIGVCDGCRKLSKTQDEKWKTIYNGIDLDDNIHFNFEKYSLLSLCRMHIAKNQVFLVDVISSLKKKYPLTPWKLYFYGKEDDQIKSKIISRAEELGVAECLFFKGETKEPLNIIKKMNLLLLPSVREGLPGVVLEALSVGRKAIVSNLDGCQEIAHIIPHVKVVEKFSPDLWADIIYENCEENDNQANLIVKDFRKSIFIHDNHVKAMLNLWEV